MGVVTSFVDRSIERRSTLANPAQWMLDSLIGPRSATGRSVSPDSALKLTTVWACITLLSETIASLPWPVYRRLTPRGKERAPRHPLYRLLHDAPNPEMTSFEFREALVGHLETWGNAYAEIEFDNAGRPIALWPLRPDRMLVERITERQERRLRYTYTVPSGRQFFLPPERVLHWRGLSADGLIGYSPISLLREAIGLGLGLEEYAARFFGNDSRPGGVLEHPGRLSEDAQKRLKASWESAHRGLEQSHRVAVLEEGVKWQSIGLPPQDAQFIEARKFQTGEIARIWRVPPHMVGDVDKTSSWGAGVEQQTIGLVVYTLRSRLVRIEQATTRALLAPAEQQTFFCEFLVDGLLRGDQQTRTAALHTQWQDGVISHDEWREIENRNPLPDGMGSHHFVPVNMQPIDLALAPPPEPEPAPPALPPPAAPTEEPETDRLAPGERDTATVTEIREYRCRKCNEILFKSPSGRGQIEALCRARLANGRVCRELQTVLLGG